MCLTDPRPEYSQAGKRLLEVILASTSLTAKACSRSGQELAVPAAGRFTARTDASVGQRQLPDCPLENGSKPPSVAAAELPGEESPASHHHRVVLIRNESASSEAPTDPTVGYCLYRSRKDKIEADQLNRSKNRKRNQPQTGYRNSVC
jgi:hypothetical protein